MGLPPPMLMIVSIEESFCTKSVASSSCATGACCLILEKVPAWCLELRSSSTCRTRDVLVAREEPVMMKALEEEEGRQEIKLSRTEKGP